MPISTRCIVIAAAAMCGGLLVSPPSARAQLPSADRIVEVGTIGSASGSGGDVFGRIVDVALDSADNVFVLDGHFHELRAFDASGRLIARFGRDGPGPGEFAHPTALAVAETGELYVLDRSNARVSVVRLQQEALSLSRDFRITHRASDLCVGPDGLYLLGLRDGRVIHRYSFAPRLEASFGRPFRPPNITLESPADAYGKLACPPEGGVIAVADQRGVARRYARDGTLLWEVALPGFTPMKTSQAGPRITSEFPAGGAADAVTGAILTDREFAVQVGRFTADRSYREIRSVRTHVLDVATGDVVTTLSDVPKLSAISPDRAVGWFEDPFPRITIYRLRQ